MSVTIDVTDLLDYTDWERQKWRPCLRSQGDSVLSLSAGPHGDGRFHSLGDLIKHIFSAEKRYIDRLSARPLTDPATIPANSVDELFAFGERSRSDLRHFLETLTASAWDVPEEYNIAGYSLQASPRKIVVHVLMHEIRHWAQIATALRFNGLTTGEMHDFIISPVLGGGLRRV